MKECNVTVIVPNYNHEMYLTQRIDSILAQTYKNFELIILDDSSTDGSRAVIEKYRHNPHVSQIIFNESNSGSTFLQWKKGFNLAKGQLIWIAESDDSCYPTLLENLVKQFDDDPNLTVAFVDSLTIDENNIITGQKYDDNIPISYSGFDFIRKNMLLGNSIYNASAALFRLDKALSISQDYIYYKGAGDYMFWIEMSETGNISHVRKQLNLNRRHSRNITKSLLSNGNNFSELRRIYEYNCAHGYVNCYMKYRILWEYIWYAYTTGFSNYEIKMKIISSLKIPYPMILLAECRFVLRKLYNKLRSK